MAVIAAIIEPQRGGPPPVKSIHAGFGLDSGRSIIRHLAVRSKAYGSESRIVSASHGDVRPESNGLAGHEQARCPSARKNRRAAILRRGRLHFSWHICLLAPQGHGQEKNNCAFPRSHNSYTIAGGASKLICPCLAPANIDHAGWILRQDEFVSGVDLLRLLHLPSTAVDSTGAESYAFESIPSRRTCVWAKSGNVERRRVGQDLFAVNLH